MKKILRKIVEEYRYDSKEERELHIEEMIKKGFEVDGQVRRSDDSLWKDDREYYWFAHFWKYE